MEPGRPSPVHVGALIIWMGDLISRCGVGCNHQYTEYARHLHGVKRRQAYYRWTVYLPSYRFQEQVMDKHYRYNTVFRSIPNSLQYNTIRNLLILYLLCTEYMEAFKLKALFSEAGLSAEFTRDLQGKVPSFRCLGQATHQVTHTGETPPHFPRHKHCF